MAVPDTAHICSALNSEKVASVDSDLDIKEDGSETKSKPFNGIDSGVNNTETVTNSLDLDSSAANISNKEPQKITLIIHINVPHNKNATEWCRIYPYPVAPPFKKVAINELPIKDKELKSLLLSMSYWSKTRADKPYPAGGWRMQYAMEAALKKSGLGVPHTIFTEYPWVDNIIPYVRKETIAINAKEKARVKRYYLMQQVFDDYRSDLEVQSFNKGLFPIDVPILRERGGYRKGRVKVDKANWWIVAMHKISGLKYYWLYPVRLNDNAEQLVTLNEDNAILIEGAW